jgi:hypothetical protein
MPILKKSNQAQKQQPQQSAKNSGDPFAKRYAETEAASGGGFVPPEPGTYNALIVAGVYEEDGQKEYAYLEVQIVDEDVADAGKNCRLYYNFVDENGQEATGMRYFKSNMQMLGKEDDFKSKDEAVAFLARLAEDQTWIVIDVKKKGKWTNIFLSSVPEDQSQKPALINPY